MSDWNRCVLFPGPDDPEHGYHRPMVTPTPQDSEYAVTDDEPVDRLAVVREQLQKAREHRLWNEGYAHGHADATNYYLRLFGALGSRRRWFGLRRW